MSSNDHASAAEDAALADRISEWLRSARVTHTEMAVDLADIVGAAKYAENEPHLARRRFDDLDGGSPQRTRSGQLNLMTGGLRAVQSSSAWTIMVHRVDDYHSPLDTATASQHHPARPGSVIDSAEIAARSGPAPLDFITRERHSSR